MKLAAGDLDRQITFQARVQVQNSGSGAYSYTWDDIVTVWAQVQDVLPSRAENVADNVNLARRPARIRCRYRSDITSDMRILYGSRTLQIVSGPVEIGRRDGLEMMAEEFSTSGEV